MRFILTIAGILLLVGLALTWIFAGGFRKAKRRAEGFWRRLLLRQLWLLPIYLFVLIPGLLGYLGSNLVRTRGDERAYRGPRFDAQGDWRIQTRSTLRREEDASGPPDDQTSGPTRELRIEGDVGLRGFFVPCREGQPRASVLLVHGLFRSAMELETVASMFRDLGTDVLLLELRNHGGSEPTTFAFGEREDQDVLAGVRALRTQRPAPGPPLVLFGVSMGAVAAARAAPGIEDLAGLVLDAPMTELLPTAHRQLERALGLPRFYASLVLWNLELFAGCDMASVRPIEAFQALPSTLPCLFIGGGRDHQVPPEVVREAFAALPSPPGLKTLWIEPDARHGRVWQQNPEGYRQHLEAFLQRVDQTK